MLAESELGNGPESAQKLLGRLSRSGSTSNTKTCRHNATGEHPRAPPASAPALRPEQTCHLRWRSDPYMPYFGLEHKVNKSVPAIFAKTAPQNHRTLWDWSRSLQAASAMLKHSLRASDARASFISKCRNATGNASSKTLLPQALQWSCFCAAIC